MNTENPIIEELKKKPSYTTFFVFIYTHEKASYVNYLDFSFDLDSVNLSDLGSESSLPNENQNQFDEEEDVGCGCVRFWNWLCPKR